MSRPARAFPPPLPRFRLLTRGFAGTDDFSVSPRHIRLLPRPRMQAQEQSDKGSSRSCVTISKLLNDGASSSSPAKWESDYVSALSGESNETSTELDTCWVIALFLHPAQVHFSWDNNISVTTCLFKSIYCVLTYVTISILWSGGRTFQKIGKQSLLS